jgi:accessory colonization factor AcfC
MNFVNFVLANWDSILAALGVIAVAIFAVVKQEKAIIFKMLYALVTEAEKTYGAGTGELKLSSVVSQVYEKAPTIASVIPVGTLEKWVNEALEKAKEKWAANKNVATYITPDSQE